jgi:GNAT superfamily N-acetyltransferase
MRDVRKIELPVEGLDVLLREASAEGFAFLDRLQQDWADGTNRFCGKGEAFYGVFEREISGQDHLVAIGGLSLDPYVNSTRVGRLRRIYVRPTFRRQGIGAELVAAMLADAHRSFQCVRLRAENAGAARLYESFGFQACVDQNATHLLRFEPDVTR